MCDSTRRDLSRNQFVNCARSPFDYDRHRNAIEWHGRCCALRIGFDSWLRDAERRGLKQVELSDERPNFELSLATVRRTATLYGQNWSVKSGEHTVRPLTLAEKDREAGSFRFL